MKKSHNANYCTNIDELFKITTFYYMTTQNERVCHIILLHGHLQYMIA